jgi:hypothetical protein
MKMTVKMIRYEVRPEESARNEELIRGVFDALRGLDLDGFRYEVFVLGDGVSFVHVVEHAEGANPLPALPEFERYVADVRARCVGEPKFDELREVGSTAR